MKLWPYIVLLTALLCSFACQSATAKEEIKVGATVSLSGKFAELGRQQYHGTKMWAHDINARGALLGRKVKLVYYDDGSDPKKSAQLYERLITRDKVDLLLGPYSSDLTIAASSVAEKHDFPMLATGAAASRIWSRGYTNIFGIDAPARNYMKLALDLAQEQGLRRVALVYANNEFTREVAQGVRAQAAEHNLEIVFDEEYVRGSSRLGDVVRRIKRTNPDIVIGGAYFTGSVAVVREAKAQGLTPKVMVFTVGPAVRRFGEVLGRDAEGVMAVAPWKRSARMPGSQDFSFRYNEQFGYKPSYHAAYGYAAGQVLEAAVRLAQSLDREKVREQLGSMKFRSLLGHYRVDENGEQTAKQIFLIQWQKGRRQLILPENLAESPAVVPFRVSSSR
ncbi:MAG: amino acid ABC transporter substrate-binding protein [Gammaproteobacteria bacterium]|nr:amino acid ABC transporter substrate-binding protein [Gammaproteobacteria bacterium]